MNILPTYEYTSRVCLCPRKSEECDRFLGTGITDNCELPCGHREWNPDRPFVRTASALNCWIISPALLLNFNDGLGICPWPMVTSFAGLISQYGEAEESPGIHLDLAMGHLQLFLLAGSPGLKDVDLKSQATGQSMQILVYSSEELDREMS